MPPRPATIACACAGAILLLAPSFECAASDATPVATRARAQRVRVERVAPPRRVPVRRARLAQAPLESMAAGHPGLRERGGEPAPIPRPAPALVAGGRLTPIARAVFAGDFALVRDARGGIRRVDFTDLDALLLEPEATIPAGAAVADLPGAGRIVGAFRPGATGGPSIDHPALGRFPLEGARRLRLLEIPGAPALDQPGVVLRNGDILLGAPLTFGAGVAVESRDRAALVAWDRVAEVVFDAPAPQRHGAIRAHLADGTVLEAAGIVTRPGARAVDLALAGGGSARLSEASLVGVSRPGADLAPLRPGGAFETHAGAILARPGTHALDLPPGAAMVRGVVTLPPGARRWGVAYVTLWTGGRPVFFAMLDADRPGAAFSVPVGGPVTMTVHTGRGGQANAIAGVDAAALVLADE